MSFGIHVLEEGGIAMTNPGSLAVAAKLVVNVHDLNNEGSVGQTTDIRMIRMVDESGKQLGEIPAVSGRMLKHWHLAHVLREELSVGAPQLCDKCKVWEPDRQTEATSEEGPVRECVICDLHGFLSTKTMGRPPRRSSCVSFSWLLPVLGTDTPSKQVVHSRVAPSATETKSNQSKKDDPPEEEPTEEEVKRRKTQMIFYKSYASGVYGMVCSLDLARIGTCLDGSTVIDDTETKRRRQMAVRALLPVVMGALGASQSHALPHTRCLGLLAALSEKSRPLPNLVSPIYSNGFGDSAAVLTALGGSVKSWGYGDGAVKGVSKVGDVQAVFDEVLREL